MSVRQRLAQQHIGFAPHRAFNAGDVAFDLGQPFGRDRVCALTDHALGRRGGHGGFLDEGSAHMGSLTRQIAGWYVDIRTACPHRPVPHFGARGAPRQNGKSRRCRRLVNIRFDERSDTPLPAKWGCPQ